MIEMYIKRSLENKILRYLDTPEIIAIMGPRQCGKSTLVSQIFSTLPNAKMLSFEDVNLLTLFEQDVKAFAKLYIEGNRYVFIDEAQYAANFGKNMKYLFDTYKNRVKLVISGSSATDFYLNGLKYLVGRIFVFNLHPFSFLEFVSFKKPGLVSLMSNSAAQVELNPLLDEFVLYGGYPRVVLAKTSEEKRLVLSNLYTMLIQREIGSLVKLLNQQKLVRLVMLLATDAGNLLNYSKIASETGLTLHELKGFLDVLQKTFVVRLLQPFFTNRRLEIVKNPKLYFVDNGLRNAILDDFSSLRTDKGVLFESFVHEELVKADANCYYWRSKSRAEVDFVVKQDGRLLPIEVKAGKPNVSRSFHSFIQHYQPGTALIINRETQEDLALNGTRARKIFFSEIGAVVSK